MKRVLRILSPVISALICGYFLGQAFGNDDPLLQGVQFAAALLWGFVAYGRWQRLGRGA